LDLDFTIKNPDKIFEKNRVQKKMIKHIYNSGSTITILAILISSFVLTDCTTIKYVGDTYEKTNQLKVFYSFNEIEGKYKVFGHIVNSGSKTYFDTDDLMNELKKEAMNRGADAIVVTNIDIEKSDNSESEKLNASLVKFLTE